MRLFTTLALSISLAAAIAAEQPKTPVTNSKSTTKRTTGAVFNKASRVLWEDLTAGHDYELLNTVTHRNEGACRAGDLYFRAKALYKKASATATEDAKSLLQYAADSFVQEVFGQSNENLPIICSGNLEKPGFVYADEAFEALQAASPGVRANFTPKKIRNVLLREWKALTGWAKAFPSDAKLGDMLLDGEIKYGFDSNESPQK